MCVPGKAPLPAARDMPAGQLTQLQQLPVGAVKPVVSQYDPDGHSVGDPIPVVGHIYPAGHTTSAVEPDGR